MQGTTRGPPDPQWSAYLEQGDMNEITKVFDAQVLVAPNYAFGQEEIGGMHHP